MKENTFSRFLFIATLSFFVASNIQAQLAKKITISVKEIAYDDADFTALQEMLKKNYTVKLVTQSYSPGVADLTLMYTREAAKLLEEIPSTFKRCFEIAGLGDYAIGLNYRATQKNAGNSDIATHPAQTKKTDKKDCFECDYFPLCEYDYTKLYRGHVFRGVRQTDGTIIYYNCENGNVTKKWVTSSNPSYSTVDYDPFTNTQTEIYYESKPVYTTHTEVILKTNAAIDEKWVSEGNINRKIMMKNASILIDGVRHDNVIIVCKWYRDYHPVLMKSMDFYSYDYYVKGTGQAFSEEGPEPIKMSEKLQRFKKYLNSGKSDMSLVGIWSFDWNYGSPRSEVFNISADGTFELTYKGFEKEAQKGRWKVDNDTLLLFHRNKIDKRQIEKITNQQTGKPSIIMRQVDTKQDYPALPADYFKKNEYKNISGNNSWQ